MKIVPNNRSYFVLTTPLKWEAVNCIKEWTQSIHHVSYWCWRVDNVYHTKNQGYVRTIQYTYRDKKYNYILFSKRRIEKINNLFEEKYKDTRWKIEIYDSRDKSYFFNSEKSTSFIKIKITKRPMVYENFT